MNWKIEYMEVKPVEGSFTNVVVVAGWRCTASNQNKTASNYGTCSFSAPGSPFTPYADLTENQVLGWCWANGVDKAETEASVQSQLDALINPPVVQEPLPWA